MASLVLGARLALAAVFAVAGIAKLLDREGSRSALSDFGVPSRALGVGAAILPLAELAVAAALVPPGSARWAAVAAIVLLAGFCLGIANAMRRGEAPDCHCFGQLQSAPAGRATLARNAVLALPAGLVVAEGPGPSLTAWVDDRTAAELSTVALGILAGALALVSVRLWRERRDLRSELAIARSESEVPAAGLPVGATAPGFALPDLEGRVHTLESLRAPGKPVALLFVSQGCGPCEELFPEIGRWQAALQSELTIAVITLGTVAENRPTAEEHGIETMLLQEDFQVSQSFGARGTPAAVIVGADGRIASQVVGSQLAIEPLIRLSLRQASVPATASDRVA